MATGRLVLGLFTQKRKMSHYILALFGFASLVYTGLFFLSLDGATYGAIFLAGISISALLPFMITLAGLFYSEMAGTVLGFIKVAAGIGGILLPLFMSLVAKAASFQASEDLHLAFGLSAHEVPGWPGERERPSLRRKKRKGSYPMTSSCCSHLIIFFVVIEPFVI